MTKKLTILFMMAVLTVALAAAGCGKKDAATTEGTPAAGTAVTPAAPESGAASTATAPDTTKH